MKLDRIIRQNKVYSDHEYLTGLKKGDRDVTESFFYILCSYTLNDIRWSLMRGKLDYDELVSELYLYLSADGWHKLDTFEGKNGCTLKSWMVKLIWRFFMGQRARLLMEASSCESEITDAMAMTEDTLGLEIAMDVESTFGRMANKRYVQVLRWMLVEGYDADAVAEFMGTTASNVYNIKHRAIVQFVETYSC
ncbi:MAG: hypothetical protein K2N91_00750 [Muribaculaceae bacterium]|nr:hypothetical protein [Muribaculaceae bacterium]